MPTTACRWLYNNQLSGTVPASVGSLSSIQHMCAPGPRVRTRPGRVPSYLLVCVFRDGTLAIASLRPSIAPTLRLYLGFCFACCAAALCYSLPTARSLFFAMLADSCRNAEMHYLDLSCMPSTFYFFLRHLHSAAPACTMESFLAGPSSFLLCFISVLLAEKPEEPGSSPTSHFELNNPTAGGCSTTS